MAQTNYHAQDMDIKLTGTSNLHPWEMKANGGASEASFIIDKGKLSSVSKLTFSLPVINLESGHRAMDKNTYKALHTDINPDISYVLTSAKVIATSGNNYRLDCIGKMTIAGTTNVTELLAIEFYDPSDQGFTVTGIKKMKMTDYNIAPPKALPGTLKTGNDISISYKVKLKNNS